MWGVHSGHSSENRSAPDGGQLIGQDANLTFESACRLLGTLLPIAIYRDILLSVYHFNIRGDSVTTVGHFSVEFRSGFLLDCNFCGNSGKIPVSRPYSGFRWRFLHFPHFSHSTALGGKLLLSWLRVQNHVYVSSSVFCQNCRENCLLLSIFAIYCLSLAADCDSDSGSTDRRPRQQVSCSSALHLRHPGRGQCFCGCIICMCYVLQSRVIFGRLVFGNLRCSWTLSLELYICQRTSDSWTCHTWLQAVAEDVFNNNNNSNNNNNGPDEQVGMPTVYQSGKKDLLVVRRWQGRSFSVPESFGAGAPLQRYLVTWHLASHWLHGLMICTHLCITCILIFKLPLEHIYLG